MTDRVKHTAGFTLAELMMSIAIILVLAAIAIPSFITAQNNMRMVELNNAAQSIANAAQTQMTAKKVSGTWMDLVRDGDNYKSDFPVARLAQTDTNVRLMTAATARSQGIVPSLSIDDTVRNADYIIEFDASTASVTRVFYSDGKSGFFGTSTPADGAVQTYYTANGAAPDDQDRRLRNNPMVGYYEGAPAGATSEVALRNPVIWVDEKTGCLMIQDPNISEDGSAGSTNATVRIENTTQGVSFVLSGLNNKTNMLNVENIDGTAKLGLLGDEMKSIVTQVGRDGAPGGNVYSIDLNALSNKASSKNDSLRSDIFAKCAAGDDLTVQVEVEDENRPCVPSTATAHIKWPEPVGKLTIMVGTPWSTELAAKPVPGENNPEYLKEEDFDQPVVRAETTEGGTSNTITAQPVHEDFPLKDSASNNKLKTINKQSGYQSYLGKWVGYAEASRDRTFVLNATMGAFKGGSEPHQYMPWELWAKKANGDYTRIGYVRNGTWEWAGDYALLEKALTWYDDQGAAYSLIAGDADAGIEPVNPESIVSVSVNANKWDTIPADLGVQDADGNVTLFMRTAPRVSEVEQYFDNKAKNGTLLSEMLSKASSYSELYDKISARGIQRTINTKAATNFETEFGASSSDAAWTMAHDGATGFENGNVFAFDRDALRVYYSIAPGLGFPNIKSNGSALQLGSTEVTNASLFMYTTNEGILSKQKTASVNNDVADGRGVKRYFFTSEKNATDFELSTVEDYRFYRAVTYYENVKQGEGEDQVEVEVKLDIPSQYVPYADQDVQISEGSDKSIDGVDFKFDGWKTADVKEGDGITIRAGQTVASYDASLSYTGAKLVASYRIVPKFGLTYLELDKEGNASGYYGYLGETATWAEQPPIDNEIASWGYYAIVEQGSLGDSQQLKATGGGINVSKNAIKVKLGDKEYDAYALTSSDKVSTKTLDMFTTGEGADEKISYWVNFNFACAVASSQEDANAFGTDASPWIVRHATQFPGAIKPNGGANSPQAQYVAASFKQTHSIDMADAPADAYERKFSNSFTGTYDGGSTIGCVIENFRYRLYGEQNHRQGLFPHAKSATLKNIKLEDASGATQQDVWDGQNVNALFGCLVGEAQDCAIQNCDVVANKTQNEYLAIEVAEVGTSNASAIGSLVGLATNTTFSGCSVNGLSLSVESRFDAWNINHDCYLGALVGQSTNSSFDACTVDNVILESRTPTVEARYLFAGGLIGYISSVSDEGKGVAGCSATSVTILAEDQNLIAAGGIVGFGDGGNVAANNSFSSIRAYYVSHPDGVEIQSSIGKKEPPK